MGFRLDGPAWLRHKACVSGASASRVVRTGRKLRHLDAVRDAWHSGVLSAAHVDVIVANVKERHIGLFAEHQHDIVKQLAAMTVEDARKVVRWWSLLAEDLIPGPDNDDPPTPCTCPAPSPTAGSSKARSPPRSPPSSTPPCN
jgi:hypothetical protein